MDGQLNPPPHPPGETEQYLSAPGAMPPDAPLEMPVQDRNRVTDGEPPERQRGVTWFARLVSMATTLAIGAYGISEMIAIVGFSDMTHLQAVMMVFFSITLLWIAFSCGSAVAGLLTPHIRFPSAPIEGSRTALLMPVYNEDPIRTTASLQAMAEELASLGAAQHFEIVIVSDSTNADAWVSESLAIDRLRRALTQVMPVRYRRRWHNVGRKVGNVEDFVKRWGGHYDYMIVLDADSLMSPATLVTLVERMQADPRMGILQTVPSLIGQTSLFARLQQFASCLYGAVIARGLSA
ncbi:MAG TPA: glycosyltransferase, partial [Povalibacter sp.]